MEDPKLKAIYIQVPEKEYIFFKVFALKNNLTLQMFLRHAAMKLIKEVQNPDSEDESKD